MTEPPHDAAWHDRQYDNRARVPEALAILRRWHDDSAAARAAHEVRLDLACGPRPSDLVDVFLPRARPAPVLVHFHGGYWRALSRRDHSFVAPAFVAAGAMVVVAEYALCPAATIGDIVAQVRQTLAWTWRQAAAYGGDPSRIVVSGHSAGGHLAAMLLATDWPRLEPGLPADLVRAAVAVSGVYDLEPLRHAPFLAPDLRLDAASARRWSPVAQAAPRRPLHAVVGGDESEEFVRQNGSIRAAWGAAAVPTCETVPGRHHLDVLDVLCEPSSRLHGITRSALAGDA